MTFALTNFKALGILLDTKSRKRGHQILELTVSRGAAGDVALDIYNTSGTFWTAAKANATYGALATKAAGIVSVIMPTVEELVSCEITASNGFLYRRNAAPSANSEYQIVNAGSFPVVSPSIVLFNDAAPAILKVVLVLSLLDQKRLQEFEY